MQKLYHSVDDYPPEVSACGVMARLLDGLGFRFYWSTEGLTEDDYRYSPGSGCRSMGEMVWHIWGLMNWIHLHLYQHEASRPRAITDQRDHALEMIQKMRGSILEIGDGGIGEVRIEGLPFWHMINGPIADAISHVGQINTLRRLHGKVPIQANVFMCRPPMEI